MIFKRMGGMAVLFALLAFPVSASMVSFSLVETGLSDDVPGSQVTSLWEGGLMSAFFDAGHIVTNSPIARMKDKPAGDSLSGQLMDDFNEAVNGGADYFIMGVLEYQNQGGRAVPIEIAVKVYEADSEKVIYEQRFPAGKGKNLDEEYKNAQDAGRIISSHLSQR